MINKVKKFLGNNVIFTLFLIIILITAGWMVWKSTLVKAIARVETINSIAKSEIEYQVKNEEETENNRFEYTDVGTFYHSPSGVVEGPFQYLYTDEFYFSWDTIARYIGDNGRYGYLNKDGSLITEPIFLEAAEFQDGSARVCQEEGKIYYIDENATRITKDYCDGSLTFEMQGEFARVQTADGTWGIINRKDEMILSGADSIEELPMVTCLGSAVIDGKAVLFELDPFDGEEEIRIIAYYDAFAKISYVYCGEFAFVWTEDGKKGVVDYKGDIIVPAEYQDIEFEYLGDDLIMDNLIFIAQDTKGMRHVIKAKGVDFV